MAKILHTSQDTPKDEHPFTKVKRYLPLFLWCFAIALLITAFCCSVTSLHLSLKIISLL